MSWGDILGIPPVEWCGSSCHDDRGPYRCGRDLNDRAKQILKEVGLYDAEELSCIVRDFCLLTITR
jgi:hypothetical protein